MKTTTVRTCTLTVTLAALALAPAALHAQSIGVNFGISPTNPADTTLAATASAGASGFAQTNYNNVGTTPTNLALKDNAGGATTATLSLTGGSGFGTYSTRANGADEILNAGLVFGNGTLTFTLTNIPYAAYSLVVYDLAFAGTVQSVTAGGVSFFTLSPEPLSTGHVDGDSTTVFNYTQGLGLTAATPTANADYVLFPLLTGASQTFTVAVIGGSNVFVPGFQIVNAVPEPSTWALLGAGAGLLGVVTLRRRRAVCRA